MNDLGSSSPLKLTNTCMMQLPHNAAAAFLQGHASEPNDFHRKWQCFKVKWKSIPTIYRRVMMFWGRATLSHSPLPQREFSAGPAFHSCFFYSTYKPTYFILLILEEGRVREKHPLVDSCTRPPGIEPTTWESNCHLLVHRMMLPPTQLHRLGPQIVLTISS